jgi:hypothetical protein
VGPAEEGSGHHVPDRDRRHPAPPGRAHGAGGPRAHPRRGPHKLVRSPEAWPRAADQELDHRFAGLLPDGDYDRLRAWLPDYAQAAQPEMGGRHLAMMLGALIEVGTRYAATVHAYGPSSGSGNYVISLAG